MRILTLIHEYPPVGGGGGRVAEDLCTGLAKRGHEVRVLTASWGDLPEHREVLGVHVHRLKSLRRESFRADLRAMVGYVWASFWEGLRTIRTWKPDVIHVHFAVPAGASAWALSVLTCTPYLLTAHLGDVPGGTPEKTGKWFRWVLPFSRLIWRRARRVVAVSEFTRGLALQHYPVPVAVIPNGVDLEELDPGDLEINDPPRIVFAGRFMEQKNPLGLVRILSQITDLPWKCALIGDGPLHAEVEAEISRLGLSERITLPGWLTPPQVLGWFGRSDVLLLPSFSEGLPVVGVQGMAMGLALALSRAGGNVELVEEGMNGFCHDPRDEAGFAEKLRVLIRDPQHLLEVRKASRESARRFDLESVVESYAKILEDVRQSA